MAAKFKPTKKKNIRVRDTGVTLSLKINSSFGALLSVILLAAALFVFLSLGSRWVSAADGNASANAPDLPQAGDTGLRRYYLSSYSRTGATALTGCDPGFHMASLWEIWDTSSSEYDLSRGITMADGGHGPPIVWDGWVRTGSYGGIGDFPGQSDCGAWTSDNPSYYGTVALIGFNWSPEILGMEAETQTCDTTSPVWCVED